jgi:DnaJ-class molecular chaperone
MQWLIDNPTIILIGLAASIVTIYPVCRWLLGFRITRVGGHKRDCRYCGGTGKLFDGTQIGNTRIGDYHPCPICRGRGVVDD